jgi:hypothetical protein
MTSLADALEVLENVGKVADLRHAAAALGGWFRKREAEVFAGGGAPEPWAPLARSTLRHKRRLGQGRRPLIATGAMLKDFTGGGAVEAHQDRVVLGPKPGESKRYAFWAARNIPHRDPTPELTPEERQKVIDIIASVFRRAGADG